MVVDVDVLCLYLESEARGTWPDSRHQPTLDSIVVVVVVVVVNEFSATLFVCFVLFCS